MSVISWNTDPSPLTLQQRATEGHYVDALVQIYKLPFSKFMHSHHMVVGAADVSCDCNQHFRGETGEDGDELHSAVTSISGVKLGRMGMSFTVNHVTQTEASNSWIFDLMIMKVRFIITSLAAGVISGVCKNTKPGL